VSCREVVCRTFVLDKTEVIPVSVELARCLLSRDRVSFSESTREADLEAAGEYEL